MGSIGRMHAGRGGWADRMDVRTGGWEDGWVLCMCAMMLIVLLFVGCADVCVDGCGIGMCIDVGLVDVCIEVDICGDAG